MMSIPRGLRPLSARGFFYARERRGFWVATVARTLKISDVIAMPEDLSVGSEERVGMAAHG